MLSFECGDGVVFVIGVELDNAQELGYRDRASEEEKGIVH